jgi:hypothetical protein
VGANGSSEFVESTLVEVLAWLMGVGANVSDAEVVDAVGLGRVAGCRCCGNDVFCGIRGRNGLLREECGESFTEWLFFRLHG